MSVKAQLIKYISALPIPETADAVSKLGKDDLVKLAPCAVRRHRACVGEIAH
jgi:hypothetical protein